MASLYAPQDLSAIQLAVNSINDKFQVFRGTLFGRPEETTDPELRGVQDQMKRIAIGDSPTMSKGELPHGYETSFRVLATCISKASEETPP